MGTVIDVSNLSDAIIWLKTNVDGTLDTFKLPRQGSGWKVTYSHNQQYNSTTFKPDNLIITISIDDREKAVEFALLFRKTM